MEESKSSVGTFDKYLTVYGALGPFPLSSGAYRWYVLRDALHPHCVLRFDMASHAAAMIGNTCWCDMRLPRSV